MSQGIIWPVGATWPPASLVCALSQQAHAQQSVAAKLSVQRKGNWRSRSPVVGSLGQKAGAPSEAPHNMLFPCQATPSLAGIFT